MSKLNKTKNNDLPEHTREAMVDLLNARLADTMDLFNQTKQAHWNIKGPSFIALHELLDSVAEHFEEYSDTIAERCVILGGVAQGTTQSIGKNTSIAEFPADLQAQNPVIDTLSTHVADYGAKLRKAINAADEAGDKDTADLFTEVSRVIDKDLWFLEAHLYG
ncbi:MAG: DNA starvation/stationary phase protection protein Dps [Myxococcota bacterium]